MYPVKKKNIYIVRISGNGCTILHEIMIRIRRIDRSIFVARYLEREKNILADVLIVSGKSPPNHLYIPLDKQVVVTRNVLPEGTEGMVYTGNFGGGIHRRNNQQP